MSAYSTIDNETFKWVKTEIEATLVETRTELQEFVESDDKADLPNISTQLHQIVGSLQMLELKSLSTLVIEGERLVEGFLSGDVDITASSFATMFEDVFSTLGSAFSKIEQGQAENTLQIVELINQIRDARGLEAVEISSLFSPMVDVFPEIKARYVWKDQEYRERAKALRAHYQVYLLHWLRDDDTSAIDSLRLVADKLLAMSTFGVVARLWWVVTAYVDYIKHNELQDQGIHSRIFRNIDDLLRQLEQQGESGLVRDPGEELIKVMLFYIGIAESRTDRMEEIMEAFNLHEYFPTLQDLPEVNDYKKIQQQLEGLRESSGISLRGLRQVITNYFDEEQADSNNLTDMGEEMKKISAVFETADIEVITPVVIESSKIVEGLKNGTLTNSDDVGFHLAAAIMFIESSINGVESVDEHWVQNGEIKLHALQTLNNQGQITSEMDGTHLSGSERQALLDLVGIEVEESLKNIEVSLEMFSLEPDKTEVLEGIDQKIRHVRGALQVIGEQKVGLLLQMSEDQFIALQAGEIAATPELLEALAISIGTMEEYVRGLQSGRQGMDYLLDRSITDLEVAIGKKVSRADVEVLLENSTSALFTWLNEQADFNLFTKLKSNLRDLLILSKKTGLNEVEELVKEQNRLVDVISQEPAFLTDNITTNLQNNMANITQQVIELYGTEETQEELESDAEVVYKHSAIEVDDDSDLKFHDDMDIEELGEELSKDDENLSSTEIARQHAADQQQSALVDDAMVDVFIEESTEVLEDANKYLEICEKDPNDRDAIRNLRRAFHTIKGSSRMVGLDNVGEVAWLSESLFNYVLDTEKPLTKPTLQFARESLDEISVHLASDYKSQHLIDVAMWGKQAEQVPLEHDSQTIDQEDYVIDDDASQLETLKVDQSEDLHDSELFDLDDSILETDSISFSVIDDQQMRDVFVQEAQVNLAIMNEQLVKEPMLISEEDAFSIAVHTMLGNSRTLGLDQISKVYSQAQKLCFYKQESATEIDIGERTVLSNLTTLTQNCVESVQQEAPYFLINTDAWDKVSDDIQIILDQLEALNTKTDTNELLENLQDDNVLVDVEEDEEILIDLEEDLDEQNTQTLEEGDTSARVAAVFDEMDPLDDLIQDAESSSNDEKLDVVHGDELVEFEESLNSMHADQSGDAKSEVTETESVIEDSEVPVEEKVQQSLIPDELTDLIEDDLMNIDNSGIESFELQSMSEEDDDEQVSNELRRIFIEELKTTRDELDEEVARLVDLKQTPAAMSSIMRHLHTIKGSALMAEANSLGELTHQTESYMESNFIHNEEELGEVRKTLEQYIDALDMAAESYQQHEKFSLPESLLARIGVEPVTLDESVMIELPVEDERTYETSLSGIEVAESLLVITDKMAKIMDGWASAKGWSSVKPKMLQQYLALEEFITQEEEFKVTAPLVDTAKEYISDLVLKKAADFKQAKALLEEVFDVAVANTRAIANNGQAEDYSALLEQMQSVESGKKKTKPKSHSTNVFVPANEAAIANDQKLGASDRATALRIRTETLDSLTNFVGDASMNRAQMREDVVSIKGVVDDLYENVLRVGRQLRELEIEADSKITSRANQPVSTDHSDEFDPLEMDRYTKLQQLSRGLAENYDELGDIQTVLSNFVYKAENILQKQDRLNRELQDKILQVRLVSFGGVGPQLRQVVRRTARELNKDVTLEIIGSDVRVDKAVLDGVVPALEHMLRNAVDHGIEAPKERTKKKKTKTGKITVECRQVAREVIINVRDDGAGLNLEKIKAKAIENNLLTKDQVLKPEDVMMYISQRGFSTASNLTQISGRGVGMDVVQEALHRMSGTISYEVEEARAGSSFNIRLPLSMAVTSAMFVKSGDRQFAISARSIERVINIDVDELLTYLNSDKPVIETAGQQYALIDLADYLGYQSNLSSMQGKLAVILVDGGVQNIAVIVEELLDTQEIVVKNLGDHLGRIPIYAGATIRADGDVVLLVDLVGISYYESYIAPPESDTSILI